MNEMAYGILALAARYWFVFLIWYILYRTVENAITEYKYDKKLKEEIPEGGYIGALKVVAVEGGDHDDLTDTRYGLMRENTLGRSKQCDVIIDHQTISGKHAQIEKRGKHFYIYDLGSTNGTFVNDKRVKKGARLTSGDTIQLGNIIMSITMSE